MLGSGNFLCFWYGEKGKERKLTLSLGGISLRKWSPMRGIF